MADLIATDTSHHPAGEGAPRFLVVERVAESREPLRDGTRATA